MSPSNQRNRNRDLIASITSKFGLKFALVLGVLGSLLFLVYVKGETAGGWGAEKATKTELPLQVTTQGKQLMRLQSPQRMTSQYRGDSALVEAMTSGNARPVTLATTDLDTDAAPDLISGYSFGQRGIVTVKRGNVEAFAPKDQEVFDKAAKGILPKSFLDGADVFDLPDVPDFLLTGDFNSDGNPDILTAARGGRALNLLLGDGSGGFAAVKQTQLQGPISALTAGAYSLPSGQSVAAIVAIGSAVEVYSGTPDGLSAEPAISYQVSATPVKLQLGVLDDDDNFDIAATAGNEVVIIHGHAAMAPGAQGSVDPQSRLERIQVNRGTSDLVIGDFISDRNGRAELAG